MMRDRPHLYLREADLTHSLPAAYVHSLTNQYYRCFELPRRVAASYLVGDARSHGVITPDKPNHSHCPHTKSACYRTDDKLCRRCMVVVSDGARLRWWRLL